MSFIKLNDEEILGPRESGAFIASKADHLIQIDEEAIKNIFQEHLSGRLNEYLFDSQEYIHVKNTDKEAIDWYNISCFYHYFRIFFIDVINFSFWVDNEEFFTVSFRNSNGDLAKQTGYFSACACVNKALKAGIPLIKANYMASVTKNELAEIFKSDSGNLIPMLDQRVEVIQEAGKHNENFLVSLLKRAQILVSDVYGCLGSTDPNANFTDINCITMFADYRVPQALAYLNVFKYSPELLKTLNQNGVVLENGSLEEVALRGCSIYACDLIVEECERLRNENSIDNSKSKPILATEVDMFLWGYRRKFANEIVKSNIPFHKVRCIYY